MSLLKRSSLRRSASFSWNRNSWAWKMIEQWHRWWALNHLQTALSTWPSHAKCQRCMSAWQRSTQASQKLEIKLILASSSSSHTKVLAANPMPTTYRRWSRKSWKCEEKHFLWKDISLITYKDISAWQWDLAKCCHLRIFSNFFGDWI